MTTARKPWQLYERWLLCLLYFGHNDQQAEPSVQRFPPLKGGLLPHSPSPFYQLAFVRLQQVEFCSAGPLSPLQMPWLPTENKNFILKKYCCNKTKKVDLYFFHANKGVWIWTCILFFPVNRKMYSLIEEQLEDTVANIYMRYLGTLTVPSLSLWQRLTKRKPTWDLPYFNLTLPTINSRLITKIHHRIRKRGNQVHVWLRHRLTHWPENAF